MRRSSKTAAEYTNDAESVDYIQLLTRLVSKHSKCSGVRHRSRADSNASVEL